jgi:hypothetical protein
MRLQLPSRKKGQAMASVVKKLGERTATIEVEGFDSFEITYKVPGARAVTELAEKYKDELGEDDGIQFRFGDMFDFVQAHLVKWSLDISLDADGLDSIEVSAITSMFVEIFQEAQAEKN